MAGLSRPDGENPTFPVALGRDRDERGSTLVELLIATTIMGVAVVAILVGSSATFMSSGANRQSTTTGIAARDYAEALDVAIPPGTSWCSYPTPYAVPYTLPAGVTSVNNTPGACPATSSTTPQFQVVTITATAQNGSTEVLRTVVREP